MFSARSLLILFLLVVPVYAQDVDAPMVLKVEGDTALVVRTLPFKVRADSGWQFYDWNYPVNVEVSKNDDVLTVISAPAGEYTISVVMMTVDITVEKDTLKVTQTKRKKFGVVKIIVGNVPSPVDPAKPLAGLAKAFQDAYSAETNVKKVEYLAFLHSLFKAADALVESSSTNLELMTKLATALRAPGVGIPKPEFAGVIKVATDHMTANIGTSASTIDKAKAKKTFAELAAALAPVKSMPHKHLEKK